MDPLWCADLTRLRYWTLVQWHPPWDLPNDMKHAVRGRKRYTCINSSAVPLRPGSIFMRSRSACVLLLIVAGCANQAKFLESKQATALQTAETRAQFEMNCPEAKGSVLSGHRDLRTVPGRHRIYRASVSCSAQPPPDWVACAPAVMAWGLFLDAALDLSSSQETPSSEKAPMASE